MPNLDHTGPHGEGSQTGKSLGFCNSSSSESGLGRRLRMHNRGCHNSNNTPIPNNQDVKEIIGIKRCHRKHHEH